MPESTPLAASVRAVARKLPFPVRLDADMGGTFQLQIDLGRRGGPDDPHDTAGIDDADGTWWIDIEGGSKSIISTYTIDTPAPIVADWIAHTARAEGSPAAQRRAPAPHTSPAAMTPTGPTLS